MTPRVSVIIPTRDRRGTLTRAVASVLHQTFGDFELIVVDDGPQSETAEWVAGIDPRVRYVRLESARGPAAARNAGIRASAADYIAFLDDDDEWYPGKLERQVRVMDDAPRDVGVVYCGIEQRLPSGTVRMNPAEVQGHIYEFLFHKPKERMPINVDSMLVRRQSLLDVGLFDEEIPYGEVYELWVRLAKHWRYVAVREALAVTWVNPKGISKDSLRVITGRRRIIEKHRDEIKDRPRFDSMLHLSIAVHELRRGNRTQARKDLARAIRVRPWNLKALAYYVLSFQPRQVRERFASTWRWARQLRRPRPSA